MLLEFPCISLAGSRNIIPNNNLEENLNMEYNDFKEYVRTGCLKELGDDYEARFHTVMKNNSISMDALLINKKGCKISPTVYLAGYWEDYTEKGRTLESIIFSICSLIWCSKTPDLGNVDDFCLFENVRNRVVYKLINYKENEELLKTVPHVRVLDLAIVFLILVDDETISNASVLIHNSHAKVWKVDTDVLYNEAKINTPKLLSYDLKNIMYYIRKMLKRCEKDEPGVDIFDDDCEAPMYVLTNTLRMYGAGTVLYQDLLESISQQLDSDLIILPSSVHEVIIVPKEEDCDEGFYRDLVCEVNQNEVPKEDILSNSIYVYNRSEGALKLMAS